MMTNKAQSGPVDTSKYEQGYQLKQDDTLDIALLANAVGTELTQVDNYNVGGLKKATQISQEKIFRNKPISTPASPAPPKSVQALTKVTDSAESKPTQLPAPVNTPPVKHVELSNKNTEEILNRLDILENKLVAIENIFTNILDKISTSTNQITLTIDNDKNK